MALDPTGPPESGMASSDMNSSEGNPLLDLSKSRAAKKEHDKIVSWAKNQFRAIRNARTVTERQWYLNLAFFFGKQHVAILKPQSNGIGNGITTKLFIPPAPYYRARPVINRIRPTIRHELAQLTSNKPNASVIPASSEERDLLAAQAGEQVWENIYINHKIKKSIRRAMWWTLVCGNGFLKQYYDFGKNDLCITPETPFHVLCPDFREEDIEEQPFVIHAQVKSPEWVQARFKEGSIVGEKLNPSSGDAADILEDSFLNLIGTQSLNRQQSVLVLELWIKPGAHPMFPEGAFFTMIGDQIVQGYQGQIYSHGEFPFTKFDHIPAGKFYSTSSIEDLIPLQKEYNRTRGQIIEAKNRMAKPQLVAPRGSVDPSKITTEPGQVIQYTPGFEAPKPLPLAPLPTYVLQEIDRILVDWNDISGQHEVSQGQTPPGVTAATAISYLQERDESKLAPTYDSLEEGLEKTAKQVLTYVHDYWDEPRVIKVTGVDGSFDALTFKGSDLGDNLDIKIEAGSSLPQSKAAKQAFIMDLMKMGFIEPNKGLEVMEIGGINKITESIQVDRKQAQRENLRMSRVTPEMLQQHQMIEMQRIQAEMEQQMSDPNGQPPDVDPVTGMPVMPMPGPIVSVNTWDNHKAHIEYHNNFRKSQAFEMLPDYVKDLFEQHVMAHVAALGVETVTMDPRQAAGLPPMAPEGEGSSGSPDNSQNPGTPGPEPMPDLSTEGGQP